MRLEDPATVALRYRANGVPTPLLRRCRTPAQAPIFQLAIATVVSELVDLEESVAGVAPSLPSSRSHFLVYRIPTLPRDTQSSVEVFRNFLCRNHPSNRCGKHQPFEFRLSISNFDFPQPADANKGCIAWFTGTSICETQAKRGCPT